jgi:peptidoglycan hydrolase CwlO-like protein
MFNVINTKILIAILATLTLIGGLLVRQHIANVKAAEAAAAAAAILQQQQKEAEDRKKEDERLRKKVEEIQKKHNNNAAHGSKNWQSYLP